MSKVLAVFGATGVQGGALIEHVLADAALSSQFTIRAITRNINSDAAVRLKAKVEVVHGDVTDRSSLDAALAGAHTVFSMTVPGWGPDGAANYDAEYNGGKAIADAAVAQGASYIIFSTLPSPSKLSGGKYKQAHHFDSKAAIEDYIRGLPIKSAFFSPGSFMSNMIKMEIFKPTKDPGSDTWVLRLPNKPQARVPLVDIVNDMGKFINPVLSEPDEFKGKTICAATAQYTLQEIVDTMADMTGKKVVFREIEPTEFLALMPFEAPGITEVFQFSEEFGYYGIESDKLVAEAVAMAAGKLTTFKESLVAANFTLD